MESLAPRCKQFPMHYRTDNTLRIEEDFLSLLSNGFVFFPVANVSALLLSVAQLAMRLISSTIRVNLPLLPAAAIEFQCLYYPQPFIRIETFCVL